ncbi:hypothetical protein OAJ02_02315 [Nitrosopumilus sp.]|nr:hypothetical protein [Nitrosopumilus sp.]
MGRLQGVEKEMKKQFRDFESAREFVKSLGLKNQKEWKDYCKSNQLPYDISSRPDYVYKKKGWTTWGNWFGTGTVATQDRKYRSYKEAREFVRSLGLKTWKEWQEYCKSGDKPDDIPYNVQTTYKNKGWTTWGDFLGTGTIQTQKRKYVPFKDVREFVRTLELKNTSEWNEYCRSNTLPTNHSTRPDTVYKNKGWKGWGDFLGTGNIASVNIQFRSFESTREFVRSLGIQTWKEWQEYCKSGDKPDDISSNPNRTYKKEWISWGDFLETGRIQTQKKNKNYLPFNEARNIARKLAIRHNIKNWKDWQKAVKEGKIPDNIPTRPEATYKKKMETSDEKV